MDWVNLFQQIFLGLVFSLIEQRSSNIKRKPNNYLKYVGLTLIVWAFKLFLECEGGANCAPTL